MARCKICTTPGCPEITDGGRCPIHIKQAHAQTNRNRPSSHSQGYDRRWQTTSRTYLQNNPQCECNLPHCHGDGPCIQPSEHTDHIDGRKPSDPGGHDPAHLQALCRPCHSRKTARHDGGFGRRGG